MNYFGYFIAEGGPQPWQGAELFIEVWPGEWLKVAAWPNEEGESMAKIINLPESYVRSFTAYPAPHLRQQSVTEVVVVKPSPLDEMEDDDEVQYIGRIYKASVLREHDDATIYEFIDLRSIV